MDKSCEFAVSEIFAKGGDGGLDLVKKVCTACEKNSNFSPLYPDGLTIKEKILKIAKEIYRADGVVYTLEAEKSLSEIIKMGKENLPICIAKTQYSISDDASKLGYPKNFNITIRDLTLSSGAGFIVALAGNILKMPGLPKIPAAEKINIDNNSKISGIF